MGSGSTVTVTFSEMSARQSSPLPPSSILFGPKEYVVTVKITIESVAPVLVNGIPPLSRESAPAPESVSTIPPEAPTAVIK